jgi:hypothetical protein
LESSWGAPSDGTICFSIQPFSWEKCIFLIFLKKSPVLKELTQVSVLMYVVARR